MLKIAMRSRRIILISLFAFILVFSISFLPHTTITPMENNSDASVSVVSTHILRFFGYNSTNAGLVTWAHAVNSRRLFREAIEDKLDFLEADILLRGGGGGGIPIMAHPPATDSDLTLEDFLVNSSRHRVGIKLDFKTIEALRGAEDALKSYSRRRSDLDESLRCPFWMNADIVGHGSVESGKVDAAEFLATCLRVTIDATLSVGWNISADYFKTGDDSVVRLPNAYGDDDVRRMRDALSGRVSASQSITFAVWAKFISGSKGTLKWLVDQFSASTLTVWGKTEDASLEDLKTVYEILPPSRVFLDLPDSLRDGLIDIDV